MRLVLQRVSHASVSVEHDVVGHIERGLLVFVGVAAGDGAADIAYATSKVLEIRVFPDDDGRMNRSVGDIGGALLVVSQFTLLGDARRGRRPAFDGAAPPAEAEAAYDEFVRQLAASGLPVATGRFRAHMDIVSTSDGPVTILLDSRKEF